MTLEEARAIVAGIEGRIYPYPTDKGLESESLCLVGNFTAYELEAIAIVMRADRAAK